jgi:hypothetical protein
MMAKLARTYVAVLFAVELLFLVAALLLHISVWIGRRHLFAQSGQAVLVGALLACFVTAFLAKERNVWKNEFKSCPVWVRAVALICALYGVVVAFLETVMFPIAGDDPEGLLAITAMTLGLSALSLCILYSVLWAGPVQEAELVRRSRTSFIAAIVGIVVLAASRAGHLLHLVR